MLKFKKATNQEQIKYGAVMSYVNIVLNLLYGLVVVEFILSILGKADYGVYKTMGSLTNSLMVLDLGLGGTVMRYIANYIAENKKEKIKSFVSMATIEACIIMIAISLISVILFFNIEIIYRASFSAYEIKLAKQIFIVLAIMIVLHIFDNLLNGIITGYNDFLFANGIKLAALLARCILTYAVLPVFKNVLSLVLLNLAMSGAIVLAELIYIRRKYRLKVCISRDIDASVFRESFIYTLLLFLTSIAVQVNGNLDNVVIGAIKGPELVTVYSFGLLIFGMYEQLSTAISGVMLPTVSKIITEKNSEHKIHSLIVKAGRIQFMLLGAAVMGFSILGKDFISLWLGKGFEDVYIITLILMLPALFELCVNVCLSVLRARNMLSFRTFVLFGTTLLNFAITVLGVKYWDYKAAAIGTAVSFIVGSLIIMNIYYYKKFRFPMLKIYAKILNRTWICIIVAGAVTALSEKFINGTWLSFIINVLIFGIVYVISLLVFGLTDSEKEQLPFIGKIKFRLNSKEV